MTTSYYAKYKGNKAISIYARPPIWFIGKEYKKLSPKHWMVVAYTNGTLSEQEYIEAYTREILDKLDAKKVYNDLINLCGEDAVLVCWESSDKFSYRHIVAEWLNRELGTQITELQIV